MIKAIEKIIDMLKEECPKVEFNDNGVDSNRLNVWHKFYISYDEKYREYVINFHENEVNIYFITNPKILRTSKEIRNASYVVAHDGSNNLWVEQFKCQLEDPNSLRRIVVWIKEEYKKWLIKWLREENEFKILEVGPLSIGQIVMIMPISWLSYWVMGKIIARNKSKYKIKVLKAAKEVWRGRIYVRTLEEHVQATGKKVEEKMIYCPKCGNRVQESDVQDEICSECRDS